MAAGKGSNSITDFRNSKKGKKGKLSAQEELGIKETPAEQARSEAETSIPASLEQQLADVGVKTGQNIPWYKDVWGLEIHAQKAVKNKNFDDFKEFSDEQIRQMYPDDPQLANYLINGKNSTFMRESKSLNEDAIAYEKKYGKVSDADVDSIIDAAIQKRDKKSLEDMSILTNDAIERWIDRHPSNSGFGKTGNILKSWRDEPAKYVIEPEVTDVNNISKSTETRTDQSAANPEKVTPERQAAKDMVDNSKPAKMNEQPAWVTTPWRETMYRLGDRTPEINPPEKYEPSSNNLWDFPELAVSRNSSRIPNYLKDAYERKVESDNRKQASRVNLDDIRPDGFSRSPARYNSFSSIYSRNAPLIHGLAAAGVLGLGGLGLYGKYKYGDINQPQTQVPYKMEPEPVNEAVVQPEPTLEQEYVTQNIPSFSSGVNNLFDLYQQQEQLIKDRAAYEAYLRAQEMGQRIATGTGYAPELKEENFEFPQNPPEVGSNIKTAGLESPDDEEVPQELSKLSGVKPRVIKDTSKGPVVLNDSNHRRSRNVQNNSVTFEQAAANQMVNQYAGIPVEVVRAKNSGYNQPPLNHATDAIWDRVRKAGLSSPEQAIRSGLFTPDEVRYITENDLWRYR